MPPLRHALGAHVVPQLRRLRRLRLRRLRLRRLRRLRPRLLRRLRPWILCVLIKSHEPFKASYLPPLQAHSCLLALSLSDVCSCDALLSVRRRRLRRLRRLRPLRRLRRLVVVKSRTRGLVVPARVWSQGDLRERERERERERVFGERETNDEMAALRVLLQTDEDLSLRMCVCV